MIPIFIPPQDSRGGSGENRRRGIIGVLLGLGIAVFLMVSLFYSGRTGGLPIMPLIIAVAIIVIGVGALASIIPRHREKQKRGLDGLDMYTLIDRMVDDLDADELGYLRSRLEQAETKSKHESAESLDEVLVQREEDRQMRRR